MLAWSDDGNCEVHFDDGKFKLVKPKFENGEIANMHTVREASVNNRTLEERERG